MINQQALKLTKTREIAFAAVFTTLAVYAPMLVHYFGGVEAGRKFLPMPFFVLVAGLLFGWRVGLVTGLFAPIISYLISGMPLLNILPIIIVQLAAYGFFAGVLREKYNVFLSLVGAIVLGLFVAGFAVLAFSEMGAIGYVLNAVKIGWIGIAAQLIFLPIFVGAGKKYLFSVY